MKKLLIGATVALLQAGVAHADPFNLPAGEGRVIVTGIHTNSPTGFDEHGNVADIPTYKQNQVYAYAAYGVTDDLTVTLTPSFQTVKQPNSDLNSGLGYTDVGARYRFSQYRDWTFSIQGTVRIPGQRRADPVAQISSVGVETDLRAGVGYGHGPIYFSAEGGYRFRSGDPQNEFHADLSLGYHVAPRFQLLASSYNTISDGRGTGIFARNYRYHDVYLTGVYDLSRKVAVQFGYTGTIAGKNALRQRGLIVGLWYKF